MLLTVAICTWNRAGLLARTLDSLARVRVPPGCGWEVVVVNNACTDDTDAVLGRAAGRLPVRRAYEPRPGISYARNRGVAESRGDLILWTDDDVLVDPGWLEALVGAFDRFAADVVFGRIEPDWGAGKPPAWYVPEFAGMYGLLDLGGPARVVPDDRFVGHNANLAFRRSAVERIGAYREDLAIGRGGRAEDHEFGRRAHAAGLVVAYQPDAVVRHYIPPDWNTKAFARRRTWDGAPYHLTLLREEARRVTSLFGLPRYFVRFHLDYARSWLAGLARGDTGRAFYYELKFLRLAALAWQMVTRRPPPGGRPPAPWTPPAAAGRARGA